MDAVERLARAVSELQVTGLSLDRAQVTATDPLAVAGVDGDVQLDGLGWCTPGVGDWVWILRQQTRAVILGTVTPNEITRPSTRATVSAVSGSVVSVQADGAVYAGLPFLASYSPTVGDSVQVMWMESATGWDGLVLGKTGAYTPPPPAPKPKPAPKPVEAPIVRALPTIPNPYVVRPSAAAVWRGGKWRTDTGGKLYQGAWGNYGNNQTVFYFGGRFAPLKGRTITRVELYLHAGTGGSFAATTARVKLHDHKTKGTSLPPLTGAFDGPALADGAHGWRTVDLAQAATLAAGTHQGIALSSGGSDYGTYIPISTDPMQGALRFYWA